MNTGICWPLAGFVAWLPRNTPVLSLFSWRSRSDLAAMVARYAATASAGVAAPNVHRASTSAGHWAAVSLSTRSCSGASTMYVAPNNVSWRVVNTSMSPASVWNSTDAPVDRPIQLRCMALTFSGQSSTSRSSSSRSEYAVMRIIHCRSRFRNTGKFPRPLRPLVVVDVGGGEAAAGVMSEAQPPQLATEVDDVRLGADARMRAGLDGVLLGGQAERVEAQRMQYIAARHSVIAGVNIGRDVAERVPDVQPLTRRVGEHVLHEHLVRWDWRRVRRRQ